MNPARPWVFPHLVGTSGVEPESDAYKAPALPLSYAPMERGKGVEPSASTLARSRSAPELPPRMSLPARFLGAAVITFPIRSQERPLRRYPLNLRQSVIVRQMVDHERIELS